jgi:hypothetical protein
LEQVSEAEYKVDVKVTGSRNNLMYRSTYWFKKIQFATVDGKT